jgi:hypothetical protein
VPTAILRRQEYDLWINPSHFWGLTMIELKRANAAVLPYLDEKDFEQMRNDTRKLVEENKQLKKRILNLETELVTQAWAGWSLH